MISLSNISVHYGGRTVLDGVNVSISPRERIGLVGKNGAGKSTLMKIIAGHNSNFSGTINKPVGSTIGYLHQDMLIPIGKTVIDETMTAFEEVNRLEGRLDEINHELSVRTDYESDAYHDILVELSDVTDRINRLGGGALQSDAEKILSGLGFKVSDFDKQTSTFSGGWKMRIELAKMLLQKPDYLLLDEPTNHLDIESIIWLEEFLENYEGAVVVISHDLTFLDNVTKRTVEIELGKIHDYKANYSNYLELRKERREKITNAFENQQNKIEQTEKLIEKFRAKANKASFAQSLIKQLDRMDKIEIEDEDTSQMRLVFPPAPRSGEVTVEVKNLSKFYGEKHILDKIDLQLIRGEKVAFVGKNGEGKSTLIKMLVGDTDTTSGEIKLGHNVLLGYYAQEQSDALDPNLTVLETIDRDAPFEMRPRLRSILGSFLFSGGDVDKKVLILSGGERARLALACLLLRPINLLVLDEPTNHLDIRSKNVLKEALIKYDGAMIVVSHDRDFLNGLTDTTIEFSNKKIHNHIGDINAFLEKRKVESLREVSLGNAALKPTTTAATPAIPSVSPQMPAKSTNSGSNDERKKIEKEIQAQENKINKLEQDLKKAEQTLVDFESPSYQQNLSKYNQVKTNLDSETAKWEELMERL
jgi:ATP-binding cassette subfamily F protein 3